MDNFGSSNELLNKWEKVLDGIEDGYTRRVTATLLENQAKSIVKSRLDEAAVGTGTTTVGQLGTFQKFAFPLVRRVFPELIANHVVGVQPMSGPVSQIFYIGSDRVYGTTVQNVYSKFNLTYRGLQQDPIGSRDGGYTDASGGTGQFETSAGTNAGLDGDDTSFDLSSMIAAHAGSVSSTYGGQIAAWPDSSTILGWSVSAGETLEGTGIPEVTFHIQQQPVVARTRKMRALWTIEASQDLKAYHNIDLERELTDLLSKELALEIDRELIEDLRMIAYDPSAIAALGLAGGVGGWYEGSLDNANSNNFGDTGGTGPEGTTFTPGDWQYDIDSSVPSEQANVNSNVFVMDLTSSAFSTEMAPQHVGHRYANLLALVNFASQDIYRTTQRGPGTVLITSPLVATMLESAAKLEGGMAPADKPTNMGTTIQYKGRFAGKYELYVDPLYPQDEILVGYKGTNAMDAGFVYCPYIPMEQLPTITDPESFQPRKGIITRYGKAAVQPAGRYYRIIRVVGPTSNWLLDPFARVTTVGGTSVPGYK